MVTITLTPEQVASVIAQQGGVVITPTGPTISPPPPPPPPPNPYPSIPGFVNTRWITIAWGDYNRKYSKDAGGLCENDCLIIKFTVPADAVLGSVHNISGAEWIDLGEPRLGCLSLTPGDFSGSLGYGSQSEGTSFGVLFVIGPKKPFSLKSTGMPGIMPGQTAYFNLKQRDVGENDRSCNVFVSLK